MFPVPVHRQRASSGDDGHASAFNDISLASALLRSATTEEERAYARRLLSAHSEEGTSLRENRTSL